MTPEEIEQMEADMKEEREHGFGRWGWFAIIEKLANGDITKFEEIYKQNIITALTLLTYWNERDKHKARIEKQIQQNNN